MPITVSGTQITFNDGTTQSTAFTGGGGSLNYTLYTSGNNTWTAPSGVTRVKVTAYGGGGGGGGGAYPGGPVPGFVGYSGGIAVGYVNVTPGTGYAANVGAGGTGGGYNASGATGGTTSFAGTISALGGSGGSNPFAGNPGSNGSSSGGNIRSAANINAATQPGIYGGAYNNVGSGQTPQVWSATSTLGAGFGGESRENAIGFGGVGGFLLIEYVN